MVSSIASAIIDDPTFLSLQKTFHNLMGVFYIKISDTSKRSHLIQITVKVIDFDTDTNNVNMMITFTHSKTQCVFRQPMPVNVVPLAHVSQNLVLRFIKLFREMLDIAVHAGNYNYMSERDFLMEELPLIEDSKEYGIRDADSMLIQEIRRLIVSYFANNTQIVYNYLGMKFETAMHNGVTMNTLLNYFVKKTKLESYRLKIKVITVSETNLATLENNHKYDLFTIIKQSSNSSLSPRSSMLSPSISPGSGKGNRSATKRRGFVLTNRSLKLMFNSHDPHHYMKTKEELSKFLGWQDYLTEDQPEQRHDKLVKGVRPLDVFLLKYESEFYLCTIEIVCPEVQESQLDTGKLRSYILQDFKLAFQVIARNGEVLQKAVMDPLEFSNYVDLKTGQLLSYVMERVTRSLVKHRLRKTICDRLTQQARKMAVN